MPPKKKTWTLKNYSEEEVLQIIKRVVNNLASRFKFTYNEVDDMKQEGTIIALKAIESIKTSKYDESKGNLEGFLWTCVHNGLFNLKRDKYNRPDSPNEAKKNVLLPISFEGVQDLDKEKNMELQQQSDIKVEYNIVTKIIDEKISIRMRPFWIKMKNDIPVNLPEKTKLLKEINKILCDAGFKSLEENDGFEER